MIPKRYCMLLSVWMVFAFIGVSSAKENENSKAPLAFIPQTHFQFSPVPEGTIITHNFTIQNRGNAPLVINRVNTGWGCTAVSYSDHILPGQEGKISIKVDTHGSGGRELRKTIVVFTNEPSTPQQTLSISGQVEVVFNLTPRRIDLRGTVGSSIMASATLVPAEKYPFTIKGVNALDGKYIAVSWKAHQNKKGIEYIVDVKNLKNETGRYRDTIVVKTDSTLLPEIRINVYGNIGG